MVEFNLSYPHKSEGQKSLVVQSGHILFMVGPNGAGKSTLMHLFTTQNPNRVRRITAHRQVWFHTDAVELSPASRLQTEQHITNQDRNEQSRYRDDFAQARSQATIFDLIDSENIDARKIAGALRAGRTEEADRLSKQQAPIAKMNDILRISNLNFQVDVEEGSKLLAIRPGCPPYSIAELSDGERNALLVIANVLTAPKNTLILIDEPERHLHRSIVSPLISTLLSYRGDCAFIISTHDVSLPHDQERSSALLLREYFHSTRSWVADFIESVEEMDEEIANAVLGSRRILLFVEGRASSLDIQLYQIIFPHVTIKPLGSCIDVERVVRGIAASRGNHWVRAFGIIDRDNRSADECQGFYSDGIFPINQYSVESLYYHPVMIKAVLRKMATIATMDVEKVFQDMQDAVIAAVNEHKYRLASRLVERKVKEKLVSSSPNWKKILHENVNIHVSTQEILDEEKAVISKLLSEKDIAAVIARYPVRETRALELIAQYSHFQSQEKYEQAVRKLLIDSSVDLVEVKKLLNPVAEFIES